MKTEVEVSANEVARIVALAVMARPENRMRHCAAVEVLPPVDGPEIGDQDFSGLRVIVFDTMQAAGEYAIPGVGSATEVQVLHTAQPRAPLKPGPMAVDPS